MVKEEFIHGTCYVVLFLPGKIDAILDFALVTMTTRAEQNSGNQVNCNELLILPREGK